MDHFLLNNNDIQACIELACDGVNLHLQDQSKLDVIHKIMYAVATAAQSNHNITAQLEENYPYQYVLNLSLS